MTAKQTIYGPYRVKNIGVNGDVYQVVEMIDNQSNTWEELRPNKTYLNPQSAYGRCARLNRRWQDEHALDDNWFEMRDYWMKTTN